jgi:hypothetical protein
MRVQEPGARGLGGSPDRDAALIPSAPQPSASAASRSVFPRRPSCKRGERDDRVENIVWFEEGAFDGALVVTPVDLAEPS